MAIFKFSNDAIQPVEETSFAQLGISERQDIQRLLRDRIEVIAPETLVIDEEFVNWDDSKRRIDLLAIDKDANLVVIELKRTEDGGHMELQALRYAAMVSTMSFEQAVDAFSQYLIRRGDERDARQTILEFLDWESADEDGFANDVRIILASADFSKELTTAVLWLLERQLDIRCVRIKPYGTKGQVLLDVQQVIPLPEAEEYQVRVREKKQAELSAKRKSERWNGKDFYVSLGEGAHANWEDCRKYGFVTGCGGRWYTRTLDRLFVGARVFVNIPKTGYVGVGVVTEKNQTIDTFKVEHEGNQIPILEAPLVATEMDHNTGDRDLCANLIRVEWIKTVSREEAFWEKGLFALQHTACKLKSDWSVKRLCEHFEIEE